MKKIKVNKFDFFYINKKGMVFLEFLLTFLLVFMIVATFMQIGFILRHEAVVIAATKSLARHVEINGELTQPMVNTMNQKLRDVNIGAGINDNSITIRINNTDFHPNGYGSTVSLAFRQEFQLSIKTYYRVKSINMPLIFATSGKSEKFKNYTP